MTYKSSLMQNDLRSEITDFLLKSSVVCWYEIKANYIREQIFFNIKL